MERAFTLWVNENITIEVIEESKKSKSKALVFKPGKSKNGIRDTYFNDTCWGEITREYAESVESLAPTAVEEIRAAAYQLSKKMSVRRDDPSSARGESSKPAGPRARLVDLPLDE